LLISYSLNSSFYLQFLPDTISDTYLGSRDTNCISRYLFCNRWLQLHFWCSGTRLISWQFTIVLVNALICKICSVHFFIAAMFFSLKAVLKLTLLLNCSDFRLLLNYCSYELCLCVGKNEFFICIKNFIVDSFWTYMQLTEVLETEMLVILFAHLILIFLSLSPTPPLQQLASLDLGVFLVNPLGKQTDSTWKVQEDGGKLK